MNSSNATCEVDKEVHRYQHNMYVWWYIPILVSGLLGNLLALWVFMAHVRETKKVVFMMNLAMADLLQVLSLPVRIYYYITDSWPLGHASCMLFFYLKYVNMYASIFFLVCVSVRRCELIMRPLRHTSPRRRGDWLMCAVGWLLVCLCCLPFPMLRAGGGGLSYNSSSKCFADLPTRDIGTPAAVALLMAAEVLGFVIPLALVLACTCLMAGSLREQAAEPVPNKGEKRRALWMVLGCAGVFLLCFAPYHITMPLDFLVKAKIVTDCEFMKRILLSHPVTLCLASLNCSLDPFIYYFTTDEFQRHLSEAELPDGATLSRRLSCISGED